MQSKAKKTAKKNKPVDLEIEGKIVEKNEYPESANIQTEKVWQVVIRKYYKRVLGFLASIRAVFTSKRMGGIVILIIMGAGGWYFGVWNLLSQANNSQDTALQSKPVSETPNTHNTPHLATGNDQQKTPTIKSHTASIDNAKIKGEVTQLTQKLNRLEEDLKAITLQQNTMQLPQHVADAELPAYLQKEMDALHKELSSAKATIEQLKNTTHTYKEYIMQKEDRDMHFMHFHLLYKQIQYTIFTGKPYTDLLKKFNAYLHNWQEEPKMRLQQYAQTGLDIFIPAKQSTYKVSQQQPQNNSNTHSTGQTSSFLDIVKTYSQNIVSITKKPASTVKEKRIDKIDYIKKALLQEDVATAELYIADHHLKNDLSAVHWQQLLSSLTIAKQLARTYQTRFSQYMNSPQ